MTHDPWDPSAPRPSEPHIGVRELRGDLATYVRRAGAGEAVVITVDGRPVARLVPLSSGQGWNLDDLIAAGLVDPPRTTERPPAPAVCDLAAGLSTDRSIEELRGR